MTKVVALERLHNGQRFIEMGDVVELSEESIAALGESVQPVGFVPPQPPAVEDPNAPQADEIVPPVGGDKKGGKAVVVPPQPPTNEEVK